MNLLDFLKISNYAFSINIWILLQRSTIPLVYLFLEALIIARSNKQSSFARDIGKEHNIITISITELVEE